MKCGFTGGLIVDYPHSTKAKKYFLMLNAGFSEETTKELVLPKGIEDMDEEKVDVMGTKNKKKFKERESERKNFKGKDWVSKKKDRMRKQVRNMQVIFRREKM